MFGRYKYILVLLIFMLFNWGCAYHLRYTVSADRQNDMEITEEKTFAMKPKMQNGDRGSSVEAELLSLIEESLWNNGWMKTSARDARYIFSVYYVTQESRISGEFKFRTYMSGKKGIYLGSALQFGKSEYSDITITITAFSQEVPQAYIWTAQCSTGPVMQGIKPLARHIIPFAISKFPQEGTWEIREKVHLHES